MTETHVQTKNFLRFTRQAATNAARACSAPHASMTDVSRRMRTGSIVVRMVCRLTQEEPVS
jgi:hypothetical protein